MTEGPFGGPRPFATDEKAVVVIVGIDGPALPRGHQIDLEAVLEQPVIQVTDKNYGDESISLTTYDNPTEEHRKHLGGRTLSVIEVTVETGMDELDGTTVESVEKAVVDKLTELAFNVEGTEVVII